MAMTAAALEAAHEREAGEGEMQRGSGGSKFSSYIQDHKWEAAGVVIALLTFIVALIAYKASQSGVSGQAQATTPNIGGVPLDTQGAQSSQNADLIAMLSAQYQTLANQIAALANKQAGGGDGGGSGGGTTGGSGSGSAGNRASDQSPPNDAAGGSPSNQPAPRGPSKEPPPYGNLHPYTFLSTLHNVDASVVNEVAAGHRSAN